jgi:hypothetical protein
MTLTHMSVLLIFPENQRLIWIAIRSANVDDSVAIPFFLLCYLQQLSTCNLSSTVLVEEQNLFQVVHGSSS